MKRLLIMPLSFISVAFINLACFMTTAAMAQSSVHPSGGRIQPITHTHSAAMADPWLPPLSGAGFHRVGDICILKNDAMTVALSAGKADTAPTLIGIKDEAWNLADKIGTRLDKKLSISVNMFDGGPSFTKRAGAGDANTMVIALKPEDSQRLWDRWENKCMFDAQSSETVTYKVDQADRVYIDAREFYQPSNWSQFKSCAGIYFLSSSGPCQ